LIGFVLLACGGAAPESEVKPLPLHEQELVSLEAPRLLRRMSLDLRGVLPSVEDLNEVEANPEALEQIWPNYLTEPTFEERLVELFAEQWLTRVDGFNVSIEDYFLASSLQSEFVRSVGEEPMRILARVAMDRCCDLGPHGSQFDVGKGLAFRARRRRGLAARPLA
jgi:hypothetical protein